MEIKYSVFTNSKEIEENLILISDFLNLHIEASPYKPMFVSKPLYLNVEVYEILLLEFNKKCIKELETSDKIVCEMYFTEQFEYLEKIKKTTFRDKDSREYIINRIINNNGEIIWKN